MRVVWADEALDQLANHYTTLSLLEQDAVARTVQGANSRLAIEAETLGESRTPWTRVWFTGGLILRFDLSPNTGTVTVYDFSWVVPRKR